MHSSRLLILCVLPLLPLFFASTQAQPPPLPTYASKIAEAGEEVISAVAVDSNGNSYVVGNYRSPSLIFRLDGNTTKTLSNLGGSDVFVVKYKPTGALEWAQSLGGLQDDLGVDIAVESSGLNVYITGLFMSRELHFGAGVPKLTNEFYGDLQFNVFLVKINNAGRIAWTTQTGDNDVSSLVIDNSKKRLYVTGAFPSILLIKDGKVADDDTLLARKAMWTAVTGGDNGEERKLDTSGWFDDDPDAIPAAATSKLPSSPSATGVATSSQDVYLDYYSTGNGELIDGTVMTGDRDDYTTDLVLEPSTANPVVCGIFESTQLTVSEALILDNTTPGNDV